MDSIRYIDRENSEVITESVPAGKMMHWLYGSVIGKATLHALFKRKFVSSIGGWYMNRPGSKKRIQPFIDEYDIDMSAYVPSDPSQFKHFNDFFYRKVNPEKRPIGEGITSPADGKLLAFQSLKDVPTFFIKGSEFSIQRFLNDAQLSERYAEGSMAIVRLAPTDYHRYHFPVTGKASASKIIKGFYFSVSPIALRQSLEIFCENQREYNILDTEEYGDVLMCEVGATMVGSIVQTYAPNSIVPKGSEKGYFAFGGSTVVLLFQKGKMTFDKDLIENTLNGMETQVKMGEQIGS